MHLGYDTKQSHGEVPVLLELWGLRSTLSLPSLPGRLWLRAAAPDRVLSRGQIEKTVYGAIQNGGKKKLKPMEKSEFKPVFTLL